MHCVCCVVQNMRVDTEKLQEMAGALQKSVSAVYMRLCKPIQAASSARTNTSLVGHLHVLCPRY